MKLEPCDVPENLLPSGHQTINVSMATAMPSVLLRPGCNQERGLHPPLTSGQPSGGWTPPMCKHSSQQTRNSCCIRARNLFVTPRHS